MASSSSLRSWRTAFLSLRDETLTPPRTPLPDLLRNLIFSQTEILLEAAPELPSHEVTSDSLILVELVAAIPKSDQVLDTCIQTCHLIHHISCRVCLEIKNSSSWALMLEFLEKMIQLFLYGDTKRISSSDATMIKAMTDYLQVLRNCPLLESSKLVKLLLQTVSYLHMEPFPLYSSGNQRTPQYHSLWEIQTVAFVIIGDIFSRSGSSVALDVWQATLEVIRKVMDVLASKNLLEEDYIMSRFYSSLLNCLHLVLSDPKGPLADHIAGLVASLQKFFMYGLTNKSVSTWPSANSQKKKISSQSLNTRSEEPRKSERGGAYRPPHLRKRDEMKVPHSRASDDWRFPDNGPTSLGFTSSDSEHSDNDGPQKVADRFRCSKARIAAITCIQDLCQADPKSLTAHWTLLLPTSDVLQPRRYQATLMTCLLFDPTLKTRSASASALAAMLDGSASVYLQVAEYKEPTKCGSFTTLSSSLGQVLVQLHAGLLYLIQSETNSGLLASLFKVLILLINATPYSRMPGELLPNVLSAVLNRILEDLSLKTDQISLLASSFSCIGAALSTSPPEVHVAEILQGALSTGVVGAQVEPNLLSILFQYSQQEVNPCISFEALQALRSACHNYPNVLTRCWEQISCTVSGMLGGDNGLRHNILEQTLKGDAGTTLGFTPERCLMAAIKVLNECLRAVSGFNGTDYTAGDELLETPFLLDCSRMAFVSSAPYYGLNVSETLKRDSFAISSGVKQWSEVIENHLPFCLSHSAPMVRAASITCFAGMTSSVYFSLATEKQKFVIASTVNSATKDVVASVRSAACRAIGVISCFPKIFESAVILDEFIHAVEINTHDTLVSVRIPASWALANICDSLRHKASDLHLKRCSTGTCNDSGSISLLIDCALRLTRDGDKVKSNAVRALGNLARFVNFTRQPSVPHDLVEWNPNNGTICTASGDFDWLERMVQAFVSCVTTGNVKVQWNVCHALGNLFQNETLRLQEMTWVPSVYSILLLLLRDSTNFKIRIHAAAALAVPATRLDYGSSFQDVIQGLENVLENLGSLQISTPSSFKYKATLERQLTSTTLHVLGLASSNEPQSLKDFLVKKASFLEDWFELLCSSLAEESRNLPGAQEIHSAEETDDCGPSITKKKIMISKAINSLLGVFKGSDRQKLAARLEKLADSLI
ncbi:uncharacterized protein [Aristolochia californica]|uniref:uncharacterized protein isoform X2 n=1 Tax=Aristolochia californica TaxID=171875 RepID=UPI0035DEAD48